MHIPDGFLSTPVWATLDVVNLPAIGWMAKRAKDGADDRKIPLLGVMGAFVFAAQMINFPVGLGTSGHLLGGALLSIVLGPAAACVVMAAILAVQAFVFQDGGIVVLGANLFNMALAGVGAGYLPYKLWGAKHRSAAIFSGGAFSVVVSACLALGQLMISGVRMPGRVLGVSLALFAVSALIEGAITVSAANAIERLNPSAVRSPRPADTRVLGVIALASVILAVVGMLWASSAPDGIESIAGQLGLSEQVQHWLPNALAGYEAQALSSEWLRKAVAGLAGLVLIYTVCAVTGRFLARRNA
jgi:cobalt/nickel transport system permease protein